MNSSPARLLRASSFDILDLFAHPLELGLRRDDELRDVQPVGFCAYRVDLAIHFLEQEIELSAARFGTGLQRFPVRKMSTEPGHFFADVRACRRPDDLLRDEGLVQRHLEA